LKPPEGHGNVGHSGSTSGFSASFQRFPDDKIDHNPVDEHQRTDRHIVKYGRPFWQKLSIGQGASYIIYLQQLALTLILTNTHHTFDQ